MGEATIISGGADGLYDIELTRDIVRITEEIAALTTRLAALTPALIIALAAKNAAQNELILKRGALDIAIGQLILKLVSISDVNKAQSDFLKALNEYSSKEVAYLLLLQERESKNKQKKLLEDAVVPTTLTDIWCADLTEDLVPGEPVGTIEINGESSLTPIIFPGGDYDNLPLSLLQPTQSSTSAGVFYNAAIFPGWQRWKPTYRIGTITSISGDVCNVTLDTARSNAQQLNINPLTVDAVPLVLSNVPIEYMDGINGEAFLINDRVVVEFTGQSWDAPKVIGFESNPRVPESIIPNYYIFYNDAGTLKIASSVDGTVITDTKTSVDAGLSNTSRPIKFHLKRFRHNVITDGQAVARDLFFVATSLYIDPDPYSGWTAFAAANPTFALVTNNLNTQITKTSALMADLATVNSAVNDTHSYTSDFGSDNWKIMAPGESGDCEDFALTKAQALLDLGYPASALHIECGVSETGKIGHAWLVVQTDKGNYALDVNNDAVVRNSSLRFGTEKLINRRRQIGMNWAFISPFAWLNNSQNVYAQQYGFQPFYSYEYHYILDPLMNILYPINVEGLREPKGTTKHLFDWTKWYYYYENGEFLDFHPHFISVNFSRDNNTIYLRENNTTDLRSGKYFELATATFRLEDNQLLQVSYDDSLIPHVSGEDAFFWENVFIDRDGSNVIIMEGQSPPDDIVSEDGYYSFIPRTHPGYETDFHHPSVMMGKTSLAHIKQVYAVSETGTLLSQEVHDPYGAMITVPKVSDPNASSVPDYATNYGTYGSDVQLSGWSFIDTTDLLIQAYIAETPAGLAPTATYRKIYKNGVDCLANLCVATGVTEENILGFAYIPCTNRLSIG